jgi:hypothetical protein
MNHCSNKSNTIIASAQFGLQAILKSKNQNQQTGKVTKYLFSIGSIRLSQFVGCQVGIYSFSSQKNVLLSIEYLNDGAAFQAFLKYFNKLIFVIVKMPNNLMLYFSEDDSNNKVNGGNKDNCDDCVGLVGCNHVNRYY